MLALTHWPRAGASARGTNDWFSVLSAYLAGAVPGTNVSAHNGAVPATPSSYMALCLEHSLPDEPDLVFVEYVLNDGAATRGRARQGRAVRGGAALAHAG